VKVSDLTSREKFKLEGLFNMETGYVLDFSNRTFEEFFLTDFNIEIYDPKYHFGSNSKANLLRKFWSLESNYLVGQVTKALMDRWRDLNLLNDADLTPQVYDGCIPIVERLLQGGSVEYLDAIKPFANERDLELLERLIRESLVRNEPEVALDRLHTFMVKYVRHVCDKHGIQYDRDRPLHALYGQYVKHLRQSGVIESDMTERILKTFISLLESFNFVRNQRSLAHDNPVLNYQESELIASGVLLALKYLRSIEEEEAETEDEENDLEIPF
jgi:hypothetical protein